MRRPVITGAGVVSSIGIGLEEYWSALDGGICGIGEVGLFDTSGYRGRLGAEVKQPPIGRWRDEVTEFTDLIRFDRLSRCDILGLGAAVEAIRVSGLDLGSVRSDRIAIVIGSGAGGLLSGERFIREVYEGARPRPSRLVAFSPASLADNLAFLVKSTGYRSTISTACSSSSTAIGLAGEIIRAGTADVVITGGSESLTETTFCGFNSLRAVDVVPCRPFDRNRKGTSLGEGSAMFVVESSDSARANMKRYAEIGGYGLSADAYHATAPAPKGESIVYAIRQAIVNSEISFDDIDYINAHGTGTKVNDVVETKAIKGAFGSRAYDIPVSATKSMIGHCLGAAGALEAAASVMTIHKNVVPPTINYTTPDPDCDLNYVPNVSRAMRVRAVMSLSLAFGGNNTALVLRSPG